MEINTICKFKLDQQSSGGYSLFRLLQMAQWHIFFSRPLSLLITFVAVQFENPQTVELPRAVKCMLRRCFHQSFKFKYTL